MTYSSINKTKHGNCTNPECNCNGVDIPVVKIAKTYYCLTSYRAMKGKEQFDKAVKRNANRTSISNAEPKIRSLIDKEASDKHNALDVWFKARRSEMTGFCANCGGKSCRDDDKYYKFSIAHLVPKSHFKSVATHPDNWLELCHFGNSCHTNLDNNMIDLTELSCFDTVIQKFVKIYPHIAQDEKRRIPKILLDYIETEK